MHAGQAGGLALCALLRHVGNRRQIGRRVDRQCEGRLARGLVPGRKDAARVRIFELGEEGRFRPRSRGIVEVEQSRRR